MKIFIIATTNDKLRDRYFSTLKAAVSYFNQWLNVYRHHSNDTWLKEYKIDGKGEYQIITFPVEYDGNMDIVTVRDEKAERLLNKCNIEFISKVVKPSITTDITNILNNSNNSNSSIQEVI